MILHDHAHYIHTVHYSTGLILAIITLSENIRSINNFPLSYSQPASHTV